MLKLSIPSFGATLRTMFTKSVMVPAMAFMLAFAGVSLSVSAPAQAASAKKKVEFGLKFSGKAFRNLERAGRKAQRKRGIGRIGGGILKAVGKGGRGVTRGLSRGVRGVTRTGRRAMSRSKIGRGIQKGFRKAGRWQNKQINRAFRKCRGKACRFTKGAVKFVAPL